MKYCIACKKLAAYEIQWGPSSDQKEYSCEKHALELIQRVPVKEFFVNKIEKAK